MFKKALTLTTVEVILPILLAGIPWLLYAPNYGVAILYKHDVYYNNQTSTLSFSNPTQAHSYYPLTYVFSLVSSLVTGAPFIVEWVLPQIVTVVLFSIALVLFLRNFGGIPAMLVFTAISANIVNPVPGQLWFRSIAEWAYVCLLCMLTLKRAREAGKVIIFTILSIAVVLSDEGVVTYTILLMLLLTIAFAGGTRRNKIRYVMILGLIYLFYSLVTEIVGVTYYGSYLSVATSALESIFGFSNYGFSTHIIQSGYSGIQVVLQEFGYLALFVIIPLILFVGTIARPRYFLVFLPAFLVLGLGDLIRFGSVIEPSLNYASGIGSFFEQLLFPGLALAGVATLIRSGDKKLEIQNRRLVKIFYVAVVISVVTVSVFSLIPPVPASGTRITYGADTRMQDVYIPAGIVYANGFTTRSVSSIETFSTIDYLYQVQRQTSPVYELATFLPSPAQPPFNPDYPHEVLYSNGYVVLSEA